MRQVTYINNIASKYVRILHVFLTSPATRKNMVKSLNFEKKKSYNSLSSNQYDTSGIFVSFFIFSLSCLSTQVKKNTCLLISTLIWLVKYQRTRSNITFEIEDSKINVGGINVYFKSTLVNLFICMQYPFY